MTEIPPELVEARAIVKATLDPNSHARCRCRDQIDRGVWDNRHEMRIALAGIRRGKELAPVNLGGGGI
jgi:hypothetical protein